MNAIHSTYRHCLPHFCPAAETATVWCPGGKQHWLTNERNKPQQLRSTHRTSPNLGVQHRASKGYIATAALPHHLCSRVAMRENRLITTKRDTRTTSMRTPKPWLALIVAAFPVRGQYRKCGNFNRLMDLMTDVNDGNDDDDDDYYYYFDDDDIIIISE